MPRKVTKTGKDFLIKFNEIYKDENFKYPNLILNDFYKTSDIIEIECPKHGIFEREISAHLRGYKCISCVREKMSNDKKKKGKFYKDKIKLEKGINLVIDIEKLYSVEEKIEFSCFIHGKFYRKIKKSLKEGKVTCAKCNVGKKLKTGKEYLEILKEKYNYEYPNLVLDKKYRTSDKIKFICEEHGEHEKIISKLLKYGCYDCKGKNINYSGKEYLDRFNNMYQKGQFKYPNLVLDKKYSSVEYLEIECPKHGIFKRTFKNHSRKANCPSCNIYDMLKTGKEYEILFNKIFEGEYTFPNLVLDKKYYNDEKVEMLCPKHGITEKTINGLINGNRCKYCSRSTSGPELSIKYNIEKYLKTISSNRKILDGKEIDILIPDINLAIEFNGLFWHSNQVLLFKSEYRNTDFVENHQYYKFKKCKDKNLFLLNFYEDEVICKSNSKNNKMNLILKEILLFNNSFNINNFNKNLLSINKLNKDKFIKFFKSHSLEFFNNEDNNFNGIYYKGYLLGVFSFNKETNIVNNYCINYNIDDDLELIKELYPDLVFNVRNDSYNRFKFENNNYKIISEIEPSYRNFNQRGKGKILNRRLEKIEPEHPIRIYDAGRVLVKLK